jgi:hypothetical protein
VIKLVQLSNGHNSKQPWSATTKTRRTTARKRDHVEAKQQQRGVLPPTADVCDCADPAIALAAYEDAGLVEPTTTFPLRAVADDRRNEDNIA